MRLKPSLRKKNPYSTVVNGRYASYMMEIAPEEQSQRPNWLFGLVFVCFLVGLTRLVGLPPNFTPIIAGAIFLLIQAKVFVMPSSRHCFIFDGSLLFPFDDGIHLWFIVTDRCFGHILSISLGLKAIMGVLIWHLIVNFGVYLIRSQRDLC